jgi:hypothetical protein
MMKEKEFSEQLHYDESEIIEARSKIWDEDGSMTNFIEDLGDEISDYVDLLERKLVKAQTKVENLRLGRKEYP